MGLTPAEASRQRKLAARRKGEDAADRAMSSDATAYELMLAKLADDRRALKGIQSIEKRADIKKRRLPDYEPWIAGVLDNLDGPPGGRDDVFMTILVWMIDVGDIKGALPLIGYAIQFKMPMPEQYERNAATVVAEQVAEAALKALTAKLPIDIESLTAVEIMVREQDMPDQVRAKLAKALGLALAGRAAVSEAETAATINALALTHLRRAFALNERCGVKKDIERLERIVAADEKESRPESEG